MHRKQWNVASVDKALAAQIADTYQVDAFAALLLSSRGITEEAQIRAFLDDAPALCDPFSICDMDKAVQTIQLALDAGERIAVYGDYDADGVTASSLLYLYFEMIGADVVCYIPDRNSEGYGLNCKAIDRLFQDGVKLIVTVDNGISALKEAEHIYDLGMKLVVTDHHKVGAHLPRAEAVVDPHRSDCPSEFKDWAGVGVAFKLICALSPEEETPELLSQFADLVSLGTIADIVPLCGENRSLVKAGLQQINQGQNLGIRALKTAVGADKKELTANGVAFSLVPRINAVGRIARADRAFELLICENEDMANQTAQEISDCNAARQASEQEIFRQVQQQLSENEQMRFDRVLVFAGEGWHGGVIGIVAARIVERFGKPCIVITYEGDEAKGSGRSLDGFSLYDCIGSASDLLTHFGGHMLAAGFGIHTKDIEEFRRRVNQYAKTVEMPFPTVGIDCRLRPSFISAELLPVISMLEPFGAGNPQPTFGLFDMTLLSVQGIGGDKHVRLNLQRGDSTIQALKFGISPDLFPYVPGDRLDLAVRLEPNEYMGIRRVSIYIKEIRMSGTDDSRFLRSVRLYETIRRGERVKEEAARYCCPDRAFITDVYRYIRQHTVTEDDIDVLCYRLGGDGAAACRVMMSIDILKEIGVLATAPDGRIEAVQGVKADLDASALLSKLRMLCSES